MKISRENGRKARQEKDAKKATHDLKASSQPWRSEEKKKWEVEISSGCVSARYWQSISRIRRIGDGIFHNCAVLSSIIAYYFVLTSIAAYSL